MRKKQEKTSTFRVHAPSPKSTMPVTVRTEYPATAIARTAGSRGAGYTSSNQASSSSRATDGHRPRARGQENGGGASSEPKMARRASDAKGLQGSRCGHRYPNTAWTKARPTQTSVQTARGRGFERGSRLPAKPAAISTTRRVAAAALVPRTRRGTGKQRHCADSIPRRSESARSHATARKDAATAAVPPAWKSPVGRSMTKPRSPACASAAGAAARRSRTVANLPD